MQTSEIAWRAGVGLVLIAANAFFVAAEFAITRLRQFDKSQLDDSAGHRRAWKITDELEIYLTGCQLGISSTSVVLGVVAEPLFTALLLPAFELLGMAESSTRAVSIVTGIVLLNLIHKIWGEQTPTYLGVERPLLVARYTAVPLHVWTRVMYPLIIAGDGLAKSTLRLFGVTITRSWTQERSDSGESPDGRAESGPSAAEVRRHLLSYLGRRGMRPDRVEEVVRAAELDQRTVADIMVGIDSVAVLSCDSAFSEVVAAIAESGKTRYPLVERPDHQGLRCHFRGVLYVPSLFGALGELQRGDRVLPQLAFDAVEVPADCPVSDLIDVLQARRQELALVVDGEQVLGLVTATDAFEAIAGDMQDPLDEPTAGDGTEVSTPSQQQPGG